jgi:D-alanyl-D-alanine carboxypeptidase/Putative peptidoglycan binding domain
LLVEEIKKSVGRDADNEREDVKVVQRLLRARGFGCGIPDGFCGSRTIEAIVAFQRGFLRVPDGRVDPEGKTLRRLNEPGKPSMKEAGPLGRFVEIPRGLNSGLTAVNNKLMLSVFSNPREDYSQKGQSVTNPQLKRWMKTDNVGPFRVTGMKPAVESLAQILADVAKEQPEVYAVLGHVGMLVCRYQRNSTTRISNHSWGTAIDLQIGGVTDPRGDDKTQYGLTLIAPIFHRHGWYWGATFPTEDSMHFEGSRALIDAWSSLMK